MQSVCLRRVIETVIGSRDIMGPLGLKHFQITRPKPTEESGTEGVRRGAIALLFCW